jgi:hypothetical protein
MIKTQIQIPDHLYSEAKRIAREREISFAEVVRRGLEAIVRPRVVSARLSRFESDPAGQPWLTPR